MYISILIVFSCSIFFLVKYYIVLSFICCRQLYSSTMIAVPGLAHPDYWSRGNLFPPPGPPPPPAHQGVGPNLHSYARDFVTSGSRAITGGHHSRPSSGSSFKKSGSGSSRRQFRSTSDSDNDLFEQASSDITVVTVHREDEDPDRIPPSGSPAKRSKGLCTTLAKTTLENSDLVV